MSIWVDKAWTEDVSEERRLRRIIIRAKLHREGPCCVCGYNGPDYCQPDVHNCIAIEQKLEKLDE